MQAGLLAIAGGKPYFLSAEHAEEALEEEKQQLLAQRFRDVLNLAESGTSSEALQEELTAQRLVAAGQSPDLRLDIAGLSVPVVLQIPAHLTGDVGLSAEALEALSVEDIASLWAITDSLSGSALLKQDVPALQIIVLPSAQENLQQTMLLFPEDASADFELTAEMQAQWQAMLEDILAVHTLSEAQLDGVMPLVSFVQLPMPSWFQASLREQRVEAVQFIDAASLNAGASAALSGDDFTLLSEADLARIDQLISQISSYGQQGGGVSDFRQMLQENLAQAAGAGTDPIEQMQLNTLSASHASNQTHSQDDRLGVRILQATPLHQQAFVSPAEQVRVSITQAALTGTDRLQIRLEPAELGRVEIRMDLTQDGRAQVTIMADNRDTLDMLQRDARMLQQALREAGIEAHTQDMAFNLSGGGQSGDQTGTDDARSNARSHAQGDILPQTNLANAPAELTSSYTLSIAQGLDILV